MNEINSAKTVVLYQNIGSFPVCSRENRRKFRIYGVQVTFLLLSLMHTYLGESASINAAEEHVSLSKLLSF